VQIATITVAVATKNDKYCVMKLVEFIKKNRLYLDGAMGSRLIAMGFDTNQAELLNITHPEVIQKIHREYFESGSHLVYTNTFGANSKKIADKKLLKEVIIAAVQNARQAAKPFGGYVAYCSGPIGELLEPYAHLKHEDAYEIFKEQAEIVQELPVDSVVIETMSDISELKAALLAYKEHTSLPIFCSMSFSEGGHTFTGAAVGAFCLTATSLGADAVGINCSLGADKMLELVGELKKYASTPIFIKPNAGMPIFRGGNTEYDTDANTFASEMTLIAQEGVSILGGCCGTTPEYIKKTIENTKNISFTIFNNQIDALCSPQSVLELDSFKVIGERLNPTGKPLLKRAITEDDFDYISALCIEQAEDGADILDINAGIAGIDEGEKLASIVKRVQNTVALPLQIDTVKTSALERALRVLAGVGVVNSVNAERESLDKVLPLVKKYGAYVVGLCLDEKGIPQDAEGRFRLAKIIVDAAKAHGIDKKRVIIDPLTMAVSVDKDNPLITLQAISLIKSRLGVRTVIGLSNVSFGLPDRDVVNAQFYKLALEAGLDFAIINPKLKASENEFALNLLLGKDEDCRAYIASRETAEKKMEIGSDALTPEECIIKGIKSGALAAVKAVVDAENFAMIIEQDIIGALNKLGEQYEQGKAFLPQLIAGSDAAKIMLDYIKDKYIPDGGSDGEVMLIATVKGDVHDIGKNIVKAVLSNYGYRMIDLGKDVATAQILQAVKKFKPKYVGLSALMTTTLDNMKDSVKSIKEYDPSIVVLVGGAVVTAEFARECGADIYAKDAQDAVAKLKGR